MEEAFAKDGNPGGKQAAAKFLKSRNNLKAQAEKLSEEDEGHRIIQSSQLERPPRSPSPTPTHPTMPADHVLQCHIYIRQTLGVVVLLRCSETPDGFQK